MKKDHIVAIIFVVACIILYYMPTGFEKAASYTSENARARVISVDREDLQTQGMINVGGQELTVKLLNGPKKGQEITVLNHLSGKLDIDEYYKVGDTMLVEYQDNATGIKLGFTRGHYRLRLEFALVLLFACLLATFFSGLFQIQGLVRPFADALLYSGYARLDYSGIFISGIFIACSGAVMDLAMDIAASIDELFVKKPDIGFSEHVLSGIKIGRAVIGTMTTTLLLAYSGGYMCMMMFYLGQGTPLFQVLNLNYVSAEILNIMLGSFGVIAVAPLTALIADIVYHKRPQDKILTMLGSFRNKALKTQTSSASGREDRPNMYSLERSGFCVGRLILWLFSGVLGLPVALLAGMPTITLVQDSKVTESGLTLASDATYGCQINGLSFQQDIITSYNGYQYVAYYNGDRKVCLARRAFSTDKWETVVFPDYSFSGDDAHNTISIGICPGDGTIHLAFDHHGSELHYRVSSPGIATNPSQYTWSAGLFGPVVNTLNDYRITELTYPAFIRTPQGNLQLIYRQGSSGNGVWRICDYTGTTHLWNNDRIFISATGPYTDSLGSSTNRCAYPNNICYGPDGRLQVSWCWRESASGANHDICYAFSDDRGYNWYGSSSSFIKPAARTADQVICNTTDKIMGVNTIETQVQKLDRAYGLMNTQAHAIDPLGRPHIIMWHCTDTSLAAANSKAGTTRWGLATARQYHHYWQDTDGLWHDDLIPGYAGSRPKLFITAKGDALLVFQACRTVESLGEEIYFINGDLKIYAATAESKWTNWQQIYQLKNSDGYFMNEMLGDSERFTQSGSKILSIFVQDSPKSSRQPTAIRILDFNIQ